MIPLTYLFLAVLVFTILLYWAMVFVILYHLTRFGIGSQPKKLALLFLLGAVALFFSSVTLYTSIDKGAVVRALNNYTGTTY